MNDEILFSALAIVMIKCVLVFESPRGGDQDLDYRTVVLEHKIQDHLNARYNAGSGSTMDWKMSVVQRSIYETRYRNEGFYLHSARVGAVYNYKNNHWFYILADSEAKTIWCYDSNYASQLPSGSCQQKYAGKVLQEWIANNLAFSLQCDEFRSHYNGQWDGVRKWGFQFEEHVADFLQEDSNDCAAYAFYFAAQSMAGVPSDHVGYCPLDPEMSEARLLIARCVLTGEVPEFVYKGGYRDE